MPGLSRIGKLVSLPRCDQREQRFLRLTLCGVASSIIAVGLSWKYAIGACVLGNTIMGLVITTNGRMGATVCYVLQRLALG